ncbi:MAG: DUF58 domain-containing protein [Rhodoferax sp.]
MLLITSINYQLNLGYLLTFLLAGCALVGMHVGHATLRGVSMNLIQPEAQFANSSATVGVHIENQRRTIRHGIGLAVMGSGHWLWTDVPAQAGSTVHIAFRVSHRGQQRVPTITAETRFPLGIFRVWTVWRPAARVMVYPAPEPFAPPLPRGEPRADGASTTQLSARGDYDGVRAYRRGDPLKLIVWKKFAKADQLVSRDAQQVQHLELWLERQQSGTPDPERQLSRLCSWVLQAEQQGLDYGLRLGSLEIAPGRGDLHRRRCLEALALC